MTLRELNQYFNEILRPHDFSDDPSMNGIQVQNSDMDKPIKKVAFAVDACLETILRAKEAKERAEARIAAQQEGLDFDRAQIALAKAIARISAAEKM